MAQQPGADPFARSKLVAGLRLPSGAKEQAPVAPSTPGDSIEATPPETLLLGEAGDKANVSSGTTLQRTSIDALMAATEPPAQDSRLASAPAQNDAMSGPSRPLPGGPELQFASSAGTGNRIGSAFGRYTNDPDALSLGSVTAADAAAVGEAVGGSRGASAMSLADPPAAATKCRLFCRKGAAGASGELQS